MTERFVARTLLFSLSWMLVFPLYSADKPAQAETAEKSVAPAPVTPGPLDGRIARVTAELLEKWHYTSQPFDRSVSSKFLDRYLETLDSQHVLFLQSDLAQFEPYRANLGDLTINERNEADTRPSCEVFNRFIQRLQQRVAYIDELLKRDKFTFDSDERITINRHDLPYPKDLAEAKKLWRERLRYEYLQERLAKIAAKKKPETPAAKKDKETPSAKAKSAEKKTDAQEIVEKLSRRYHRNLRFYTEWNHDDVLQAYLTTLAHVYDPHSDYFGHAQLEQFSIGMNLSLCGIGAELQMSEDGYCTIKRLLPGPAEKSKKIKVNDRIVAVAQGDQPPVDVVDMSLGKAVQLIRGTKDTEVRLTIIPADSEASARSVVSLIRDEIKLEDQEAKAKIIELPAAQAPVRLGLIDLPSFYATFDVAGSKRAELAKAGEPVATKSTTADVARLLKKLKAEAVRGVILDLRRNGGGSLEEAIKLTGLFITEGPVVQVRNSKLTVEEDGDTDPSVLYDGPLIVLTSRFSASASEILAGALQDYGRALIVGDASTHGKGTVQSVNPLAPHMRVPAAWLTNDPGALKLTIKKFYRPSGASTQKKGVVPDIILPSVFNEAKEFGEASLDNPLEWDTIPSAKYEHLNRVEPYLTELRKHSTQRVAADRDFDYVREDIELFKKRQADKTVSLSEKEQLKEKEEAEARQKARDKERLARKETPEKVYELTLRQADSPGLPAPVQKTNSSSKLASRQGPATAGASTNSAAAGAKAAVEDDALADDEEEKPPSVDVTLVEAEHILVDYLSMLPKPDVATTRHPE